MHGLHGIDGQLTLLDTANMLPLERARLSALHSGAFISSYEHAKYDEEKTPFCTICGLADDCEHWLHCPRFAHIRDSIPDWMPDNVELPKCMLNHLLVPRIPQLVQWRSLLCNLKYGTQTFQFPLPPPKFGFHHLFVDGSCTVEAYPELQLASWGVINATAGLVVSAAHLHGPTRTIDRAELSAVISALLWGAHAELALCMWSDSLSTVQMAERIQQWGNVPDGVANFELWSIFHSSATRSHWCLHSISLDTFACVQRAGRRLL